MRRAEERLQELGIPVPKPRYKSDGGPHVLEGAEIRNGVGGRVLQTVQGEVHSFESIITKQGATNTDGWVGIQGGPRLKRHRGIKAIRLQEERVVLVRTKSDNYSAGTKITRVLIDLGPDPTTEEVEALIQYGKYHADVLMR